jgi:hypothetical protein
MSDNPITKCSSCKSYWTPNVNDIKSPGIYFKTCKKCRDSGKIKFIKNKCIHNRKPSQCKPCFGNQICIHNKQKFNCKSCNRNQLCIHNKHKYFCVECHGSQICVHNKRKSTCKTCRGTEICIHNKLKKHCRICKGSQICIHNKQKYNCKLCGKNHCIHNKQKQYCLKCQGSQICIHNKRKQICALCSGSQICEHNKEKSRCKNCNLPLYLINLQRRALRKCLKFSNLTKTKSTIEYLGCSSEYFIEFLQKKMNNFNLTKELKMSWTNIHIDHIKPISAFNLNDEKEFLSCCYYTNLQPLIASDNLEKKNKWNDKDNEYWLNNIKDKKDYFDIYIPL